jgi:hypothetical protein
MVLPGNQLDFTGYNHAHTTGPQVGYGSVRMLINGLTMQHPAYVSKEKSKMLGIEEASCLLGKGYVSAFFK